MNEDEVLTVPEAARRARVNPETIRRWVRRGVLLAARPAGGRAPLRIMASDLRRLLGGRCDGEAQP